MLWCEIAGVGKGSAVKLAGGLRMIITDITDNGEALHTVVLHSHLYNFER